MLNCSVFKEHLVLYAIKAGVVRDFPKTQLNQLQSLKLFDKHFGDTYCGQT